MAHKNDNPQFQSHPFAPVYDAHSKILILGSFPSVRSREEGFYYGHPRNRFWKMLALCFEEPVPETIAEKKAILLRHNIALWDVLASCEISGSADSSIRGAVPNDIGMILEGAPIEKILCNGVTAGKLCLRYCSCDPVILPSTSPANASWSMERLCSQWKPMLRGYDPQNPL